MRKSCEVTKKKKKLCQQGSGNKGRLNCASADSKKADAVATDRTNHLFKKADALIREAVATLRFEIAAKMQAQSALPDAQTAKTQTKQKKKKKDQSRI